MTDAVVDTVALAHHFNDSLPSYAAGIFREAEEGRGTLFVPEVVLGEFAYSALRGRFEMEDPRAMLEEILDLVRGSGYLVLSSLGPSGWGEFLDLKVPELHHRMIASDALSRGIPVISNNPELERVPRLEVIWRRTHKGHGDPRDQRVG